MSTDPLHNLMSIAALNNMAASTSQPHIPSQPVNESHYQASVLSPQSPSKPSQTIPENTQRNPNPVTLPPNDITTSSFPQPQAPSISSLLSPSVFLALLLLLLPSRLLSQLPLPTAHTVLTLLFLVLFFSRRTMPNLVHGALLLVQCLLLHHVPTLFVPETARAVLKSRLVLAGTLGAAAYFTVSFTIIFLSAILLNALGLVLVTSLASTHLRNGGTEENLDLTRQGQWLTSLAAITGNENGLLASEIKMLMVHLPVALSEFIATYILSTGSSNMLLLHNGTVATQLHVLDVVSYGVAGAAGLSIATALLSPMWGTSVTGLWPAFSDAADCGSSVLLRLATQMLVNVAVAERMLKVGEGKIFWALVLVFMIRFVDSVLNDFAMVRNKSGQFHLQYIFRAMQGVVLGATCYVAWSRLEMALLVEKGLRSLS